MGGLVQELQPNQRGTRVFDRQGNVLGYEDVYEVSDEEIEAELKAQAREEAIEELTTKKLEEIKLK